MDSGADRSLEPQVSIGGKVDGKFALWHYRTRNLYIEHHFAVSTLGIASRLVLSPIDRDGDNAGQRDCDLLEVSFEIAGPETATKLDDGDSLPGAVQGHAIEFSREFVAFGEISCSNPVSAARPACGHEQRVVPQPLLWAGVEAKNAGNDLVEVLGNVDFALPAAIGAGRVMIHLEVSRECVQQIA